jgi:hypothetical protein
MEVDDQIQEEHLEKDVPIEDTIREAISSLNSRSEEVPVTPVPEKVETPADTRARDEAGKFAAAPKDAKKRDTLSVPADKVQASNPAAAVPDPMAKPIKAAEPPPLWSQEMRTEFASLPPKVQAYVVQRELDAAKKTAANDEERLLGKKVNEMATPYLPTIRAEGATVEKAFQDYLQTAHVLRSGTPHQKAQSIAAVMNQFRVDPNTLLSILQGNNVVPGSAPQQAMHNPAFDAFQQRLDRIEADRQAEIQQRQIQEQQSLQSQINDFATKPGHEHFETVKTLMGKLLESEAASDLDEAYEMAVYANPEIRASLVAAQTQQGQVTRLAEQRARADAARRAGGSLTGGPGATRALNGAGADVPIEETIRAALREASGRIS